MTYPSFNEKARSIGRTSLAHSAEVKITCFDKLKVYLGIGIRLQFESTVTL